MFQPVKEEDRSVVGQQTPAQLTNYGQRRVGSEAPSNSKVLQKLLFQRIGLKIRMNPWLFSTDFTQNVFDLVGLLMNIVRTPLLVIASLFQLWRVERQSP